MSKHLQLNKSERARASERRLAVHIVTVSFIYLNDSIHMEAHYDLGNITHQVIQPIVQAGQYVDGFGTIAENIT